MALFKKKDSVVKEVVNDAYVMMANLNDDEFTNSLTSLDGEQKHELSKVLHKKDLDAFSKRENALCYIVIGTICAIIGVLFIFLSFKKKMNKIVGIDTTSFQFFLMIILFAVAAVLLVIGFVRFFQAIKARKICKNRINQLTKE